jgi:hypothetical protein
MKFLNDAMKIRNVFSEVFLVQILRKLRKIHSEVRLHGKKNFKKRIRSFKLGAKMEIRNGGKESWGIGRENLEPKF